MTTKLSASDLKTLLQAIENDLEPKVKAILQTRRNLT
jgi:hypothetical protein